MTITWRHLLLCVAAVLASPPAAASLLVNGGFEAAPAVPFRNDNGNVHVQPYPGAPVSEQYVPGWRLLAPEVSDLWRAPVAYSLHPGAAAEGSQFLGLNWSPLGGVILYNEAEQDFTLGSGVTGVALSLRMATESGYNGSTLVASILDSTGRPVATGPAFTNAAGLRAWDSKSWSANGLSAGRYTLRLAGTGSGNAWDVLVDDVRLDAVGGAVPEPSAWGAMILGLALVGAAGRRLSARRPLPA